MTFSEVLEMAMSDDLLILAIPIFLLCILLEFYYDKYRASSLYNVQDLWTSLGVLLITGAVEIVPKILAFLAFFYLHEISPLRDFVLRQWWAWILLFYLDDFTYYWFHRLNHEVRILWAGHISHHSSQFLNFGTALRQGVGERLHKYFFWLWIPLLGFDPLMIFIMISLNLIYQFWVHTEVVDRLPSALEYILNTPSHHRVHHASNVRYLDRNHGGALIIWDRIFGTFSPERGNDPPIYGLTKNIDSYNPFYVVSHEYRSIWKDVRRANRWSDKMKYIFYAPGWRHDGPDYRAKTLRQQLGE